MIEAYVEALRLETENRKSCDSVEERSSDSIDHPSHYSRWKMEPIEFIAINNLPWWLANVIKYTMRHDAKDGLNDLYKARSYLDMKIRNLRGEPSFWQKPVAEQRSCDTEERALSFPNHAVFPGKGPALGPAPTYCLCGVNVTSKGFECWDDDCKHKQKTGGSIHTKPEEICTACSRHVSYLTFPCDICGRAANA